MAGRRTFVDTQAASERPEKKARTAGKLVDLLSMGDPETFTNAFSSWAHSPTSPASELKRVQDSAAGIQLAVTTAIKRRMKLVRRVAKLLVEALSESDPRSGIFLLEDIHHALDCIPEHLTHLVTTIVSDQDVEDIPSLIVLLDILVEDDDIALKFFKTSKEEWKERRARAVANLFASQCTKHGDVGIHIARKAMWLLRNKAEIPDQARVVALLVEWSSLANADAYEIKLNTLLAQGAPSATVRLTQEAYEACVSDLRGRMSSIVQRVEDSELNY